MYALSVSAEGDCYLCVPVDPGIAAAALGASESALFGTVPAEALHTFTLDSGASRCFFCDSTTLTPLPTSVSLRQADPSGGPVLARSSTVLPYPADATVTTTTPRGQHVSICTSTRTGRHLATFTHRPGSSLYTLTTEPPQVAASAQVSASCPVAAPCSCCLLSHHRLGHPSLPRIRGMHSRLLDPSLPMSFPPLPPSPAPPCLPCDEGRQLAAPYSSSFPPTTASLQTLQMDVWGPARISGQGRGHYFLLVVDDYTRYTTVFPLRSKIEVPDVLIPWIRAVRLQLRERFRKDLPIDSGAARGAPSGGAEPPSAEARGAELEGAESRGAEPGGAEPGGTKPEGAELGAAESEGAESGGAEPWGTASAGGPAGASQRLSPWREPLSPQKLREWFTQRTHLRSGAAGAGGSPAGGTGAGGAGATSLGGAGVTAESGGTGGTGAAGPRGARTRGTGAARACGVGDSGAGGTGAGGDGAGGAGAGDPRAGGTGAGGARARGTGARGAGVTARARGTR
ncbi:unnamed protein product, partial [Closterium sp. NIES-54]